MSDCGHRYFGKPSWLDGWECKACRRKTDVLTVGAYLGLNAVPQLLTVDPTVLFAAIRECIG